MTGVQTCALPIYIRDTRVFLTSPYMAEERGLRIIRNGLLLGELKKNRFEPSQAFAMARTKDQFNNCLDLYVSDDRVIRYLKGETIDIDDFNVKSCKVTNNILINNTFY